MTPHVQRWVTGLIAVPFLFAVIYFGSETLFALVVGAAILAACAEYNFMAFGKGFSWEKGAVMFSGAFLPSAALLGGESLLMAAFTATIMIFFLIFLGSIHEGKITVIPVSRVFFAIVYIPLMLSYFILIRQWENGVLWIFFILILTASGDISAFYFGRTLGKHKFYPLVSPGKTVEGAIGSFAASILACILYKTCVLPSLPLFHVLILACVGSCFGQLGDLCESAIKRSAGVKDSGTIFPGHGGILDRLDSLIFLAPFVYYYRIFLIV